MPCSLTKYILSPTGIISEIALSSPSLPMLPELAESRSLSIGRRSVLPTVRFLVSPGPPIAAAAG
jgi:hypothetical protein